MLSASWPDDGGVALRQDHGPAAAGARVFPRGLLWEEVPFLLTGKRESLVFFGKCSPLILSSALGGRGVGGRTPFM